MTDFKTSLKTASEKVEISVGKVKHPEHNYSAIFSESRNNKFVFKKGDDSIIIYIIHNNEKRILEERQKGQLAAYRVVSSWATTKDTIEFSDYQKTYRSRMCIIEFGWPF